MSVRKKKIWWLLQSVSGWCAIYETSKEALKIGQGGDTLIRLVETRRWKSVKAFGPRKRAKVK